MRPEERDSALIWDMVEAAQDIVSFTKDIKFHDFENDKKLRYAVERQIMVIGEAANHVSEKMRAENSDIEWSKIVGMRNILAHEYGEVLTSRVWTTSLNNIPDLLVKLKRILDSLTDV